MKTRKNKEIFEKKLLNKRLNNGVLQFNGVDGFDVYNCSQPFVWENRIYIFGRVEKRNEWMNSWSCLFEKSGEWEWTLVSNAKSYQLEDPFICIVNQEIILGGTHVYLKDNKLETYCVDFYRGKNINNLQYFTSGPNRMKDIRLVALSDNKIGVFSRPHTEEILRKFGSETMIGFTIIDDLDSLTQEVIEAAPYLNGLFTDGEWGGCNQAYLLEDGMIGVLGHLSFKEKHTEQAVYLNICFVLNPITLNVLEYQLIGTRRSYPNGPAKKDYLKECAFASGLVMKNNGLAHLYSGIGDVQEGVTTISYPFKAHGNILGKEFKI